ncbi:hypothetical protein ANO11243_033450 [Dothideomycetidae sp. 11243]|nr:hypothetical protein ANO11243_033450 [fungal sp. No.11243]
MPNGVSPRPMRLGTRSCAECRRRKVRCVFPPANSQCQGCGLRGIPCVAQQSAAQDIVSTGSLSSLGDERLKQRLADIEVNVRDIWATLTLTGASPSLRGLLPGAPSRMPSVENHTGAELQSMLGVKNATNATMPEDFNMADDDFGFRDAPLLSLVKAASLMEELQLDPSEPSAIGHEASEAVDLSGFPILQDDDLLMVLAATEKYWSIWPPWQYGALPSTMPSLQTGGIIFAARFLSYMSRSGSPSSSAKAWLWLSLCVQQVPKTLQLSHCDLSPEVLLTSCMRTADSLLTSATGTDEALDSIEARLIQQKLYINMGWPRQAWLSVRRAADEALLLRLHLISDQKGGGGGGSGDRESAIWTEIWHLETTLALILGLPSTIPIPTSSSNATSQSRSNDSSNDCDSPLQTLHHKLCTLAAAVVARNQSAQPSYLATMQIADELDRCRGLMPDAWWDEPPRPDQPFAQLFGQQSTKAQYFLIVKLLHLPFMLSGKAGYEYSRTSAIASSRGLIAAYLALRGSGRGLFVVCESLEFQAFSAGMTLLIRLLLPASERKTEGDVNSGEDWPLIEALTMALRRTATLMRCGVANQAAEVLSLLTQAAHGAYAGPDKYNVVLPYFGKITISLSRGRKTANPEGWGEVPAAAAGSTPPFGTVELSANLFNSVHFPTSLEGELSGDWSSMADVDIGFDWTQIFTFGNNNNDDNDDDNNLKDQ